MADAAVPIPPLAQFQIPSKLPLTNVVVPLYAGKPLFLLGQNGVGKSALIHSISTSVGPPRLVYLPGTRPNYFDNESLDLNAATRRALQTNLATWDNSPDTRWKVISGTGRNQKAVHDLQSAEVQYSVDAANDVKLNGASSAAIATLQSCSSPVDRVNAIFARAELPVRMLVEDGELKARRGQAVYSIARMSDGERAALIIAAEIVSAAFQSIFVIDEPELHLHRSIVVPLLSALIAERSDCGFVVSTHELDLAGASHSASALLVRGCDWVASGLVVRWDFDFLSSTQDIPEWLRVDVLGARRKILFVEGLASSLDQPLYALLFPSISLRCRESCREVERAVAGLRAVDTLHRVEVFGLVDRDGMDPEGLAALQQNNIFPLPVFAVESFYYSLAVLAAVAAQQSATLGIAADLLLADAVAQGLAALQHTDCVVHLASRVSERQMRDRLLMAMPDRSTLIAAQDAQIAVHIESPFPAELTKLTTLRDSGDLHAIVARYPIRESGVLTALAKGLRFAVRSDYEMAALTRIGSDIELQEKLRVEIGAISPHLSQQFTGVA